MVQGGRRLGGMSKNIGYHGWPTTKTKKTLAKTP